MYSISENFYFEIDDEEKELVVIGDIIIRGKEYLIAEDFLDNNYVFLFDDEEEQLELIEDEELAEELIDNWQEEYYGTVDEVGLWEEDYENDDEDISEDIESFFEIDDNQESDDDIDSYIDGLMETESEK